MSSPWSRLMQGGYGTAPAAQAAPAQTGWGAGYQAGGAGTAGYRNDPRAKLEQRFRELVAAGLIDPNNITGPDGRVRAEVWAALRSDGTAPGAVGGQAAQATQAAGYRGPVGEPGAQPNFEVWNPAELNRDEWLQGHLALLERQDREASGTYLDPVTGQRTVTATQGNALLQTFGNAQNAQQQYRDRVAAQNVQQNQAVAGAQQNVDAAAAAAGRAGQGVIPGRGTAADEGYARQANQAVYQAQTAYNRARSIAPRPDQPISPAQMGAGMTAEQFGQLAQATSAGYSPEEMQDMYLHPEKYARQARYAPGLAYRAANLARGGL